MNLTATQSMLPILAVCALVFFLLFIRMKRKTGIRLLQRAVVGLVGIAIGNAVCSYLSPAVHIGLNPATFLTGTILGFPGVAALFALSFL